jgi:putative NADH-flavin reductase
MSTSTVLVLGGTGPAGICLLRELLHRKHKVVVFARSPSKIPQDLATNTLLEVCLSSQELGPWLIFTGHQSRTE